jgi:hypothetical protein
VNQFSHSWGIISYPHSFRVASALDPSLHAPSFKMAQQQKPSQTLVGVLRVDLLARELLVGAAETISLCCSQHLGLFHIAFVPRSGLFATCFVANIPPGRVKTYNLLTHTTVSSDLLSLRTTEFLRASVERLVQVILASATCSVALVGVVHLCLFSGLFGFALLDVGGNTLETVVALGELLEGEGRFVWLDRES